MKKVFDSFSTGMLKIAIFFVCLAIYVVVMFFVGKKVFNLGYDLFYEKTMYQAYNISKTVDFIVTNEDTWDTVAYRLKQADIIDDEKTFTFRAKIYKTKLTPGHYQFNTKQSMKNILDIIDEGEIVNQESESAPEVLFGEEVDASKEDVPILEESKSKTDETNSNKKQDNSSKKSNASNNINE